MTRRHIIVTGANGALGQALLRAVGPEQAIAVTRAKIAPITGFRHERLGAEGSISRDVLASAIAIINAVGRVTGSAAELQTANVDLAVSLARQARAMGVAKFVQVGSFSIYGYAEVIGAATPIAPATDYGRSKALADDALFDLMTTDFAVESLRLPFLFSEHRPALLAPLIMLGRRLQCLPGSRLPMQRSMITYDDAARLLANAATDSRRGTTLAADPQLFDLALLSRLVEEEHGRRWRVLTVAPIVTHALRMIAPGIARRLFRSSILAAAANRAGVDPLGLEPTLRAIVRDLA